MQWWVGGSVQVSIFLHFFAVKKIPSWKNPSFSYVRKRTQCFCFPSHFILFYFLIWVLLKLREEDFSDPFCFFLCGGISFRNFVSNWDLMVHSDCIPQFCYAEIIEFFFCLNCWLPSFFGISELVSCKSVASCLNCCTFLLWEEWIIEIFSFLF
jgi:hypothetical protein